MLIYLYTISQAPHCASPAIERRFVTLADGAGGLRQVHIRVAGHGPPVLLLHQSPRDGGELETLMDRLAASARVVAPDTPGYGLSDPLPAGPGGVPPDMDAFAAALVALMDQMGIGRAAVYGLHTGGCIALRLATLYPDRVAALVVDGVLLLTAAEREGYLSRYLPPFRPAWDGSHLVWAWARLREQALFFPWFQAEAATRMRRTPPPPGRMQAMLLELLRAGDHYRGAYGAALAQDVAGDIRRLKVPALLLSSRDDVLVTQVGRMPPLPDTARAEVPADRAAAADLALSTLSAAVAGLPPWTAIAPPDPLPPPGRALDRFVGTRGGWLRLRVSGTGRGPVVVLIPDADGGAVPLDGLARAMAAGGGSVVAIDPPGSGESLSPPPDAADWPPERLLAWQGERVAEALTRYSQADGGPVLLLAQGHGAALALAAAGAAPAGLLAGTVLLDPPRPDEGRATLHAPDLAPDPQGAHLLRAWHRLRNDGLFDPWYRETADAVVAHPDRLDPDQLQARLLPLLAGAATHAARVRAESLAPLAAAIMAVPGPVLLAFLPGGHDPQAHPLVAGTGCRALALPADPACWVPLLAGAVARAKGSPDR